MHLDDININYDYFYNTMAFSRDVKLLFLFEYDLESRQGINSSDGGAVYGSCPGTLKNIHWFIEKSRETVKDSGPSSVPTQ